MVLKEESAIIQKNPQLKQDIGLFKIVLMPLELFVLKYILINLRPTNIREIYTESIFICFHQLFSPEQLQREDFSYKYLVPNIISAGYGFGYVDKKEREKIMKKYVQESKGLSETDLRKKWLEPIKEYNSKVPSYDKIKAIFENFERQGIIYKRGKEGKGIVYAISPYFYNLFKDKRKEIIML